MRSASAALADRSVPAFAPPPDLLREEDVGVGVTSAGRASCPGLVAAEVRVEYDAL